MHKEKITKVVHICNDFYNSSIYRKLQQNLLADKIDSYMIVPTFQNDKEKLHEDNVTELKCFTKYDRLFYHNKQRKVIRKIRGIIKKIMPDVFHAHFLFSGGYICSILKEEFNIPFVVTVQNTDVNIFFKRMVHLRKVGIKILLRATKIQFISISYKDEVIKKYIPKKYQGLIEKKSVVIPFGVDEFWLMNRSQNIKKMQPGRINLITVAIINRNKNQLIVASVADLLRGMGFTITYTVLGKTGDKRVFRKLSKEKFVIYGGNQKREGLLRKYREADLFIMPSIHESFGLVYVEAMSQGLPLIYSKGQGFDGIFKDGEVGYSVDARNKGDILKGIMKIIGNYHNISRRCIEKCEKFDWKEITKLYIDMYSDINK